MPKKLLFFITSALLGGSTLSASTLDIYNDGAIYRHIPIDTYVGFTEGVTATCADESIALLPSYECPDDKRLCKELNTIKTLRSQHEALKFDRETITELLSKLQLEAVDAVKLIDASQKIGERKSQLKDQIRVLEEKVEGLAENFLRQVSAKKPMVANTKCKGEQELRIPSGQIGAKLLYEADVNNPKEIAVNQYVLLSNQSGIDINAKEAHIYAKSSQLYLRPQTFRPWIVHQISKRKPRVVMAKSVSDDGYAVAPVEPVMEAEPETRMSAIVKTGYRDYTINGLELPSTGKEVRVKVADYKVPAQCDMTAYPYRDTNLYRVCTFAPTTPVESHIWTLRKNKRLISENARGEYREGKYLLYTDVDDQVVIRRKRAIKKDQSSGIFGGTIRKKDGYTLDINNISDKPKSMTIIERIPRSTTDKIKAKLLSVEGTTQYKVDKEGKLTISLTLAPKEHKTIKVLFELRYDKDLKVAY